MTEPGSNRADQIWGGQESGISNVVSVYRIWKEGRTPPQDLAEAESPDTDDLCGRGDQKVVFIDVDIQEKLGNGSFGTVHRAILISPGKEEEISVKRSCNGARKSFEREIEFYHMLENNPSEYFLHIKFAATGEEPDSMMLGLSYIKDSKDLHEQIEAWKQKHKDELDWTRMVYEKLLKILSQLMDAHKFLHGKIRDESNEEKCVFHLDIKPKNILYSEKDEKLWLIDFGSASQPYSLVEKLPTLSQQPSGMSNNYAPPELIMTEKELSGSGDERYNLHLTADIYSIAATCYHVLTRKLPWHEDHDSMKRDLEEAYKLKGSYHKLQSDISEYNQHYDDRSREKQMLSLLIGMLDVNCGMRKTEEETINVLETIMDLQETDTGSEPSPPPPETPQIQPIDDDQEKQEVASAVEDSAQAQEEEADSNSNTLFESPT